MIAGLPSARLGAEFLRYLVVEGMALTAALMHAGVNDVNLRPERAKPFIAGAVPLWDFLLRRTLVFHH